MVYLNAAGVLLTLSILSLLDKVRSQVNAADFTPTRPYLDPRTNCDLRNKRGNRIKFISDEETRCFYWECTGGRTVFKQCPLQTRVSEFYDADDYNPCTEIFTDKTKVFDCTRKGINSEGEPTCVKQYKDNNICRNGGNVTFQGSLCWCICAPDFTGYSCTSFIGTLPRPTTTTSTTTTTTEATTTAEDDDDSEESTTQLVTVPADELLTESPDVISFRNSINVPQATVDETGRFIYRDPCPQQEDFCSAFQQMTGGPYCMNGGECQNQCLGPICLCRAPYIAGLRCDGYRCTTNVECMNGGTCNRGPDNQNPVATCQCLSEFSGPMCEVRDAR